MILAWIGLALLSASWLFAIGYFTQPNLPVSWIFEHFGGTYHLCDPPVWVLLVALGVLCLALSKVAALAGHLPADRNGVLGRLPIGQTAAKPVLPGPAVSLFGLALCVPALLLMPWPYRSAPMLLMVGLVFSIPVAAPRSTSREEDDVPPPPRWLVVVCVRLATATLLAGCVLLVQGVVLEWYQAFTAYSHELPWPLAHAIGVVGRGLGIDLAVTESTIAVHSMRKIHLLGATWELLLDPASLCLLTGGLVMLFWQCATAGPLQRRWAAGLLAALVLVGLFAIWLPMRSGLYMALFLNDALRIPYESDIDSMRLFWDPLLLSAFLLPPALLAGRFLPRMNGLSREDEAALRAGKAPAAPPPAAPPDEDLADADIAPSLVEVHRPTGRYTFAAVLGVIVAGAAIAALTLAIVWAPQGERKSGRVLVEEYHPYPDEVWEKTWTPMDTDWYGQMSGYNYYCLYQYLTHFYPMVRHRDAPLTEDDLNDDDVLIIKVPTRPFAPAEVQSIVRFVERGGGLMLIGEHTNYQRSSTFMNPIARHFGFEFRTDNVYSMRGKVYEIPYQQALVPHPAVQHVRTLGFATPCSIEARSYSGRAVIRGLALKNLPADYHAYENYMPQPEDRAETRYGAFIQLWSTQFGKGRVIAFTDSTIFSNFSAFDPDTAETMLGMVEWLRHRPPPIDPRPWLLIAGGLLLAAGAWLTSSSRGGWILIVTAGLCGWSVAVFGTRLWQDYAVPLPAELEDKSDLPEELREKVDVVLDRTVCKTPLPMGGFIAGGADTYGLFERWILRLGYFTSRRDANTDDRDPFGEEMLVFLNPDRQPDKAFLKRLVDYVSGGGKVLVVESPLDIRREQTNGDEGSLVLQRSFVNQLLAPFKISVDHHDPRSGTLTVPDGWPEVPVDQALPVKGGTPFVFVDGVAVGTQKKRGKGMVVVVGIGNRFVDDNMGYSDQTEPDDDLRQVFELEFRIVREMIDSAGGLFADDPGE